MIMLTLKKGKVGPATNESRIGAYAIIVQQTERAVWE